MKPRLFGIPATRSPVVAILRRGPSDWSQVNRWDPEAGTYDRGSWIHANIYPQRCDLSPDGRWFSYFTLRQKSSWAAGPTYIAISRLPWLTALAAWGTCGTWTCGVHFVERRRTWEVGPPAEGDAAPLRDRHGLGLELTRPMVFAVERRRGWVESADSPPYDPERDLWDIGRTPYLTMEKSRPGTVGAVRLTVAGWYAAYRSGQPSWSEVRYAVDAGGGPRPLDGVQWADWDRMGRLLVATTNGRLEVRPDPQDDARVAWSIDLGDDQPAPAEPPSIARRWVE